ncbi:N-6 DNA methylase [Candidatus Chloroploca sp. Khr17]|uniref:N-6 DNA methylase n=1 Tax=Candidatus Chloroploca sp. Khr17 TaxID=2496869 RepID=UPI00101C60CA|nr:N-6 DNA methylase [Candidatus Chloroploca sp. Khr17]
MPYTTIVTEGGLLPSDILDAIAAGAMEGQRPEDFGLDRTRNLSDRISAAWQVARSQWALFQSYLADLAPGATGTTETREQWVLPLLRVLGYQLSRNRSAYVLQGRTYAISHRADEFDDAPPVHIESIRNSLDARPPSGRPRLSPHALVQEYLNSTEHLWGIVTNGERLRLLRDSARFTRPAYVEFDLRAILEGEKFSEFAILYRLLHRSRLPDSSPPRHRDTEDRKEATSLSASVARPEDCLLEKYHQYAVEAGGRVRNGLRVGVEVALKTLGNGLLAHPTNAELRAQVASGQLTPLDYYRQLLRLVYRLLFLMVAEERGLIAVEGKVEGKSEKVKGKSEEDEFLPFSFDLLPSNALRIYYEHYSVSRLRRLAETSGVGRGPYTDLWEGLLTTFRLLEGSDEIAPRRLGLAPLDGDLFGDTACAALTTNTRLANAALLAAVRALSLYRDEESKLLRRVNYGALDVEELGSVYESLLDYRPVVTIQGKSEKAKGKRNGDESIDPFTFSLFTFDLASGSERKTTGSYYTRPELVQELIKSALVPVIEARLKAVGDTPQRHRDTEDQKESQGLSASVVHQKEAALLSIRVVDPACGSGAFLLAAARRLGRELARVRAGEDQPSPAQFRHAVRDVIRRCIFGVDLNPLAVDLCKLSLWIEGHAAGLPLSFLDHHIRHGNSLVGATRELVEAGIPDDAYKPVSGDDKATASSLKKRNKQERELHRKQGLVQQDLFATAAADDAPFAAALRALDEAADDSVSAVRARAARYAALRRQAHAERAKFDLWTAAFFQPLTPENARYVPTSKDLLDFDPGSAKTLMAAPLAEAVGFFHWELEFPTTNGSELTNEGHSFIRAQFDVVLGNPPWERIKLQEQEHFVDVPAIREAANKAARDKAIAAWRNGDAHQRARIAQFDAAKQRAEAESRFVRASERFPLTAVGDVNTYALFAEHFRNLLAPTGRAGIIVPTGIATDDSTKAFFGDLNAQKQLASFYDFENREKIFAEVDSRFKFALLTIGTTSEPTRFLFFATNVNQLADPQRAFMLTPDEIALINPNTHTAPVFRTNQDAELTKKIYRKAPVLIDERQKEKGKGQKDSGNPWGVSFLRMLDMSNDSHLFQSAPGDGLVPLYEAKLLHQFTHRWATYASVPQRHGGTEEGAHDLSAAELADPAVSITPRYWVPTNAVAERLADWQYHWVLAFRRVARTTDERTAIFTILPKIGAGDSVFLILPKHGNSLLIACFLAILNSIPFDFVVRQKVGGVNFSFFIVNQLPVLPPSAFTPADIAYIVPRVVELVYTAWDIKAFAEDVWEAADHELRERISECWRANMAAAEPLAATNPAIAAHLGIAHSYIRDSFVVPPFIWHDERRAQIRAELDARIAKLYGLTRDELRYILDPHDVYGPDFPGETFRVLKEKEQRMYGEYRTRRLVLEAWDDHE